MKKKFFIVTFLVTATYTLFAQTSSKGQGIPQSGEYKKISVIEPFVGTWEWVSGNSSFEMVLKKINKKELSFGTHTYFTDLLVGGYVYIKDGKEISNTLSNVDNFKTASILGPTDYERNEIKVKFNDIIKGKIVDAVLIFDSSTGTLSLKLQQLSEIISLNKKYDTLFSVPSNLRLRKIK